MADGCWSIKVVVLTIWSILAVIDSQTVTLTTTPAQVKPSDSLNLRCSLIENIPITGVRFYRNDTWRLYITPSSSSCSYIPLGADDGNTYTYNCDPTYHWYQVTVDSVRETEHGVTWRCDMSSNTAGPGSCGAYNGVNPCTSQDVTVTVIGGVKNVEITSEDGTPIISPVVISQSNTNTKLLCTTGSSGSRPEAQLTWWRTGTPDQQLTSGVIALPRQSLDQGYVVSKSTLNVSNISYNGVSIFCRASLAGDETISGQVILDVKFKPDIDIRVAGVVYTTYTITENQQNVQFTCNIISANPTTGIAYSWTRDGHTISGVIGQIYSITQVQKADRGILTCTAINTEGTTTSSGVNIDVQYQAAITAIEDVTLEEGTSLTQVCTADGNPQPSFRWTFGGIEVSSSATLRRNSITNQQNGTYTCHASITLTPTGQTDVSWETMATLHVTVYFGPKNFVPSQTHVNITEGQSDSSVSCTANCNPACTYLWLRDGSQVNTGATLQLISVSKSHAGNYYCEASNTFLNKPAKSRVSTVAVIVNVMYQPSITSLYVEGNNNVVSENDTVKIVCETDSNPASTFTWTHQSDLASLPETGNMLTLSSVQCSDTTFFTCTANNNIGLAAAKNVQLFVQCQPRIDSIAPHETAYGAVGESINITVQHIIAFPPPTFLWKKVNSDTISPSNQTDTNTSSALTVRRLDVDDFGSYSVTIDNNIGQPLVIYAEVKLASHPLKPTHVKTICSKSYSVILLLTPGFDGGAAQTFRIQYRRDGDVDFSNYSKTFHDDNGHAMIATFDMLQEGTVYYFRLISVNRFGESPLTEEYRTVTDHVIHNPGCSCTHTGPVIGGTLGGIIVGVLLVLGTSYFRKGWQGQRIRGKEEMRSSEHETPTDRVSKKVSVESKTEAPRGKMYTIELSRDQATPTYFNLELTSTPERGHDQLYQDLTQDRSATTSDYQALDIAGTVQ